MSASICLAHLKMMWVTKTESIIWKTDCVSGDSLMCMIGMDTKEFSVF